MKIFSVLLILLLGCFKISAQEIILNKSYNETGIIKGAYYRLAPEDVLNYSGTWISEDQNFEMYITSDKVFIEGPDINRELLVGYFCTGVSDCNKKGEKPNLTVGSLDFTKGTRAKFLFLDEEKDKLGDVTLEWLGENKIHWELKNREGLRVGDFDSTFSVPTNLVFFKKN